ncbi:MAG: EamA family transporter [Thermoplasmatota archaeon]
MIRPPGALVVVTLLGVLTGVGAILFGLAFRQLGALSAAGLLRWVLNPLILAGLALGVLVRVLSYVLLRYYSVSQVTLLSALGLVATLAMARYALSERLTAPEWAGSVLIVAGAALIGR